MVREVIIYGDDFWEFYNKQTQKVKLKINWTIGLVKDLTNSSGTILEAH